MITFSATSFFDPYGDGKSERKVFKRTFFHTTKTKQEVEKIFADFNAGKYYSALRINFPKKPYIVKTKNFDELTNYHAL